jgi:ureidoglycolate hydrolase
MTGDIPLEILGWNETGYKPLVLNPAWQVALLNWEPLFDLGNMGQIERHRKTDEVFVLLSGRAVLFVVSPAGLQVEDMRHGIIYNVHKGVWHNLISTHDASWLIVEDRNTHLQDCDYRDLTTEEMATLKTRLPDWLS